MKGKNDPWHFISNEELSLDEKIKLAQLNQIYAEGRKAAWETHWFYNSLKATGSFVTVAGLVISMLIIRNKEDAIRKKEETIRVQNDLISVQKNDLSEKEKALNQREVAFNNLVAETNGKMKIYNAMQVTINKTVDSLANTKLSLKNKERLNDLKTTAPEMPSVFIQFRGSTTRKSIDSLREQISKLGFLVPDAERVSHNEGNIIKYFADSDKEKAEQLAIDLSEIFSRAGCPTEFKVKGYKLKNYSPIEIWTTQSCDFQNLLP